MVSRMQFLHHIGTQVINVLIDNCFLCCVLFVTLHRPGFNSRGNPLDCIIEKATMWQIYFTSTLVVPGWSSFSEYSVLFHLTSGAKAKITLLVFRFSPELLHEFVCRLKLPRINLYHEV
jgi:hypothetical protein